MIIWQFNGKALEDFGWKPIICSSSYGWEQKLAKAINNFRTLKSSDNAAIIVLNDTFMNFKFNNLLSDLEQKKSSLVMNVIIIILDLKESKSFRTHAWAVSYS